MHRLTERAIFSTVANNSDQSDANLMVESMKGAKMQVEFGASVFGRGGKRLGEVDGLLVNAGTKRATSLLIDEGLFDRGKHMIGVSTIARSDADGLHLEESGSATKTESSELDSEEVSFAQRVEPPIAFIPAAGVGGTLYADAPPAPGEYPNNDSFFDIAPLDPPSVEVESNLGENEVVLTKGTQAVSNDHHDLGQVVGFELGEMGLVQTITISEGFIFKERVTVALVDIAEFGTDKVHLHLSKAAAEAHRGPV